MTSEAQWLRTSPFRGHFEAQWMKWSKLRRTRSKWDQWEVLRYIKGFFGRGNLFLANSCFDFFRNEVFHVSGNRILFIHIVSFSSIGSEDKNSPDLKKNIMMFSHMVWLKAWRTVTKDKYNMGQSKGQNIAHVLWNKKTLNVYLK